MQACTLLFEMAIIMGLVTVTLYQVVFDHDNDGWSSLPLPASTLYQLALS
jgi:hypothetical protein